MEQVLEGMLWQAPVIYPHNRIIHAKSFSDKLKLRCCFQEAPSGRTKSQSKNVPLVPETYYLPWSSGKGISTSPEKISTACDCSTPLTPKEVPALLGLYSFYRRSM